MGGSGSMTRTPSLRGSEHPADRVRDPVRHEPIC
jgi:hypothetical protein